MAGWPEHKGSSSAARRRRAWPVLVALVVLAACAADGLPLRPARAATDEATLHQRIVAEIGDARCGSDADCAALPIGAKACGGPQSYLAWSRVASDRARLEAWAGELATTQRLEQQRRGLMSDCSLVAEPAVACVQRRCVLQPGARGAATR